VKLVQPDSSKFLLLDSKRKARDLNPHHSVVARISSAARQTVSGYLPFQAKVRRLQAGGRLYPPVSGLPTPACLIASPGIEPGHRSYENQLSTNWPAIKSHEEEIRTPTPCGTMF
jgi:hypothetical protein